MNQEPYTLAKSFHEAVGALVARDTTGQPYFVDSVERDQGIEATRNALDGVVCSTELNADLAALYQGKPAECYDVDNNWEFLGTILVIPAGEGEPPVRVWAIPS